MAMQDMIAVENVIASLPKERQKAIATRGAELLEQIEQRMTLGELRKGRKMSQETMAHALGIGQMQISRLEQRKDPRLSTIQRTVAAMGGYLTMIATFPDQDPVVLVTSHSAEKKHQRAGKTVSSPKSSPRSKARTKS
jgi:DNA-binding XRE family transcriptional regulator